MLKSLQGRLSLLFIAFVLLVLISVGAMMWGLETQRQDALVINLAGRQRMLAQQMARLAFESGAGQDETNAALQDVEQTFDRTLRALLDGGTAPYLSNADAKLPITRDLGIRSALNEVTLTWNEYRALLDELQQTPRVDASFSVTLQSIEQKSSTLAAQADEAVRLYEAESAAKIARLRIIQVGFLVAALILLGVGAWITRKSVLEPLRELTRAANRLGENDLDTAVQVGGPKEMRELSESFDLMRQSLHESRSKLLELMSTLEERVAQRTRELDALNEVSREITSRLDVQQVLDSVTNKARALLGAEVASLCLLNEDGRSLNLQAMSGPRAAVVAERVDSESPFTLQVLNNAGAIVCDAEHCAGVCKMLAEPYRLSHIAAPLRVGDKVIGALCVGSARSNQYAREATDLLTKLANTAAIALENARLYRQAERVATLEERRRIAAEMHDGLAQTLSYLGLMTDQVVDVLEEGQEQVALEKLEQARQTIRNATGDVRQAIDHLMDESPLRVGLAEQIQALVLDFAEKHEMALEWKNLADENLPYSRETLEQVLHITREALQNAAKHADAKRVQVRLGKADGCFFVAVEDDGKGFDVTQPEPNGHFGLKVMEARAAHIGGDVEVESEPGRGTRVTLTWGMESEE